MEMKVIKTKKVQLFGKEYTVSNPGIRWMLQHTDRCTDKNGKVNNEKYLEGIVDSCVSPKLSLDDFESMDELNEVAQALEEFHTRKV